MKNLIKKLIPSFLISWYHFLLAFLGAFFYGFPSSKMIVIGVTGTKGKSTVVEFCHRVLAEAGFKVASLSSIRFKIGEKEWPNLLKMTMPGRFKIQQFLRQARDAGCKYVVLEVTSEGILQHRHKFINFNSAVFTNLAPEHIERHGSFEKYRAAKGKLFQTTKNIHILNLDDENVDYFLRFPAKQKFCYGINCKLKIDWKLESNPPGSPPVGVQENWKFIKAAEVNTSSQGIDFEVENIPFHLNLLGSFNVYNVLAAICVGLSQGVDLETCKKALEKIVGLPGRMEVVIKEPFQVIVDYAHTPDALEKVYEANSKLKVQSSKLICVLGSAGGGRDKWKRPKMGEIAAKYCGQIILTNEDPYDEDPLKIIEDIKKGISINQFTPTPNFGVGASQHESAVYKILDRREAIKKSLQLANPSDVVIITGKGCEPWMCVAGGKKIPWDDREIVREEYQKIKNQI